MPRCASAPRASSRLIAFTTSIEASPPPTTIVSSCASKRAPAIAGLVAVVEPVDERVLVHEAAADVALGVGHGQRAVAPRAVREHHAVEAPALGELAQVDVASRSGARHEVHVRLRRASRRSSRTPSRAGRRASAAGRPRPFRRAACSARTRPSARRAWRRCPPPRRPQWRPRSPRSRTTRASHGRPILPQGGFDTRCDAA